LTNADLLAIIVVQNEKRGEDMWNLQGMQVWGTYLDEAEVSGRVTLSRVAYGGGVEHHVKIDEGFSIANGRVNRPAGDVIIIHHQNITRMCD
tara:strand:+ start:1103 stop:1378 length:276 start_codon:yes stop_codon:yes gene_type:complete